MARLEADPAGEPVPIRSLDQLGVLTAAFDVLVGRFAAAERSYRADLSEAASIDRERAAFLAGLSHELRTPLNAILGFAHTCSEGRGRRPARRGGARVRADHRHERRAPAHAHRRRARSVCARDGAAEAQPQADRPRRRGRGGRARGVGDRARQTDRAPRARRARPLRVRRPRARAADPHEPRLERDQGDAARLDRRHRGAARLVRRAHRRGHRRRHPRARDRGDLRGVQAGGRRAVAARRRGPRPRDLEAARRHARRHDRRHEPRRSGLDVHRVHAALPQARGGRVVRRALEGGRYSSSPSLTPPPPPWSEK